MRAVVPRWLAVVVMCSWLAACGGGKKEDAEAAGASGLSALAAGQTRQNLAASTQSGERSRTARAVTICAGIILRACSQLCLQRQDLGSGTFQVCARLRMRYHVQAQARFFFKQGACGGR